MIVKGRSKLEALLTCVFIKRWAGGREATKKALDL
jgi:hypothetical protein